MNRLGLPIMKGLITLLILAIFFYLGRELVELYRVPAATTATNLLREFDSSRAGPISVRFGEAPGTFLQQEINGNKQAAYKALESACYELAQKSPLPTSKPSDAEVALLNAHLPISSDSETKEGIQVLHIDSQGPIVFAIRFDTDGRHNTHTSKGRVVCWGFATPIQSNRWNIRVVSRTGNSTENGVASINIPPGSTKILQMASPEGPEILAFKNDLELSEQIDHFNRILAADRWEAIRSWQTGPNHSMATFVREDELTKQIAKIHIRRKKMPPSGSNPDAWWGIINLTNYNKDTPFIRK